MQCLVAPATLNDLKCEVYGTGTKSANKNVGVILVSFGSLYFFWIRIYFILFIKYFNFILIYFLFICSYPPYPNPNLNTRNDEVDFAFYPQIP